jgi:hypothetical protein
MAAFLVTHDTDRSMKACNCECNTDTDSFEFSSGRTFRLFFGCAHPGDGASWKAIDGYGIVKGSGVKTNEKEARQAARAWAERHEDAHRSFLGALGIVARF